MFARKLPVAVMATAFLVFLSACGESPAPDAKLLTKLPPDMVAELNAAFNARDIARKCPSELTFNEAEKKRQFELLALRVQAEGYDDVLDSALEISQLPERELQKQFLDYVKRRGVVFSDKRTWCAAGRADIAEKTAIGKYLLAR